MSVILDTEQLQTVVAAEAERNRVFLQNASDGVHILNAAGRVVEASDSFCAMLGYTREEVIGLHPSQWDARRAPEEMACSIAEVLAGERHRFETVHRRKDGTIFDVEVLANVFELNGAPYLHCSSRDLTEIRSLQQALLDTAAREQRKLGSDLHDGLGQELTGISLLAGALAASERKAGRPAQAPLAQIEELARRAVGACRAIAHGLSPLVYARGGLAQALDEMVRLRRGSRGAAIHFKVIDTAPLRLRREVMDHLYRIAQEAVANAQRHAKANLIEVTLEVGPTEVRLEIQDNGIGLKQSVSDPDGMGLSIMRFRARTIGAQLKIRVGERGGTRVICRCAQDSARTGNGRRAQRSS